jgi:hypothetical protein
MELKHWGIILTVLGTILLAFSIRIKSSVAKDASFIRKSIEERQKKEHKEMDLIWPSETWINRTFFWSGLFCIAIGALLQW